MVKEKSINIHIHTDATEKKKKKRRRRKYKKGLTKSKYAIGIPAQGPMQSYFMPAMPQMKPQDHDRNRDIEKYAKNYLSTPKQQNLLLENGDNDQHGNRHRLLLDDHNNGHKHELFLGDKNQSKKGTKLSKSKAIEYSFEVLSKVSIPSLRSLMRDALPSISEKQLKLINKTNKYDAIIAFLKELNNKASPKKKDNKDESLSTPKGKAVRFEDNTASTSPKFEDNTATSEPIVQQPAAKQIGRFTKARVRELYSKQKDNLLKEYTIDPEPFLLLAYTKRIDYLYRVMNGDKLPHEYALIEKPETPTDKWINNEYNSKKLEELNDEAYTPVKKQGKVKHKKSAVDALTPIIEKYDPPTVDINDYLSGSSAEVPTSAYFNNTDD